MGVEVIIKLTVVIETRPSKMELYRTLRIDNVVLDKEADVEVNQEVDKEVANVVDE